MAHRAAVTVGPQGRLVIPAAMRRQLGIQVGDELNVSMEEDRLVLETRRAAARRLRGMFKRDDGRSMVDELMAERRFESKLEDLDLAEARARRRERYRAEEDG